MNNEEKKSYLGKIDIPTYSHKQELFNGISHFIGLPIGLFVIIYALVKYTSNLSVLFSLIAFGITISVLYSVSAIYHFTSPSDTKNKKIRRVIDHCTIYLLIAGTYTPICVYISSISVIGTITLILEWSLAAIGVILNAIDMNNKVIKIISMTLYLVLGWLILFTTGFRFIPDTSFFLILAGGIVYTIGSILYALGHKNLNFHGIFHVFDLVGTIIQLIGVLLLFI